ncbi:hypothetical protein A6M27_05610 [Acidithiobacillus thiooxidans]|uniref:Inner membrane protein YgaP-like transmembrane domain-containing protein n=1 Tax=Acidithiobacillus thiooxidans TaxID=930 RepID=A0A1C2JKS9_ACITH|nr:DUF2892 domain-containing protein [Acidithiobacillus thiooxidans]OCX69533.1 hypothetical protein A6P07_16340 [Acidithiobacillus thiooxidans]OCX69591.1 hypothetical protein A6O24_18170 [Acidithiobacillus thiooxidans]OCX73053.1 hypothetical protein A6M23_08530 [Acidithiobacillus thiooxidans]OCX80951.1 hypothetical protein A6O26_13980 [Acidithiobacillus thiooxidans]OCX85380.1 hypothetical protein A6P08_07920 [Acidithiobacillus thiooxidans]
MKTIKNMNSTERWLRLYFGAIIFLIYFVNPFPYREWTFSGLLLIATGVFGYCPVYSFLKKTRKPENLSQ